MNNMNDVGLLLALCFSNSPAEKTLFLGVESVPRGSLVTASRFHFPLLQGHDVPMNNTYIPIRSG